MKRVEDYFSWVNVFSYPNTWKGDRSWAARAVGIGIKNWVRKKCKSFWISQRRKLLGFQRRKLLGEPVSRD